MTFDPINFARQNIKFHTERDWPAEFGKVNYIMRGNGLWEVRKNAIGTFFVHLHETKIGGFPDEAKRDTSVELLVPKVPSKLLNQIVGFFRRLTNTHNFEAYVQIFWDKVEGKHFIVCPKQTVSQGRVKYEATNVDPHHVLVCDIHSHNSMRAFFSGVDDADEKRRGDRFFGVVGKLDTAEPEFKLSFILGGGDRVFVPMDTLFEKDEDAFPQEWLSQIEYIDKLPNRELAKKFDDFEDEDSELRLKDLLNSEDLDEEELDEDLQELEEDQELDFGEKASAKRSLQEYKDYHRQLAFEKMLRGDGEVEEDDWVETRTRYRGNDI